MTPGRASYRFSNPARKKTRPKGPRRLAGFNKFFLQNFPNPARKKTRPKGPRRLAETVVKKIKYINKYE